MLLANNETDSRLALAVSASPLLFALVAALADVFKRSKSQSVPGTNAAAAETEPLLPSHIDSASPSRGGPIERNERWSFLNNVATLLVVLEILIQIFALAYFVFGGLPHKDELEFPLLILALWTVTWGGALLWIQLIIKPKTADHTVGNGFLPFIAACFIAKLFELRTSSESADAVLYACTGIQAFTMIFLLGTEACQRYWQSVVLVKPPGDGKREASREFSSGLLSWLSFAWMDALLIQGYKKPLEDEDLQDLDARDFSDDVVRKFKLRYSKKKTTLFKAIVSNWFWQIVFIISFAVFLAVLSFSGPFFLNLIVRFLENEDNDLSSPIPYIYLSLLLFCQFLSSLIIGRLYHSARRLSFHVRAVLISLIYDKALKRAAGAGKPKEKKEASMFDKPDDNKASIGKIVTLMSSDTERVANLTSFMHFFLVDVPLSCALSIIGLLYVMGPSALAGISVIVLSGPLTGLISSKMIKAQIAYTSATDKRTTLMNEALQGIRVIKYFGWEPEFIAKIAKARELELSKIKALWTYWLSFYATSYGSSITVIFVSFFFYSFVLGKQLTASTAFTSISLLRELASYLGFLPMIAMQIMRAKVSLDRVADFLAEQELDKYVSNDENGVKMPSVDETTPLLASTSSSSSSSAGVKPTKNFGDEAVGFQNGRFIYYGTDDKVPTAEEVAEEAAKKLKNQKKWYQFWKKAVARPADEDPGSATPKIPFVLRDINVMFPPHKLTAIVGPTGSGKTSLLLALTGEMKCTQGRSILPDPRTVAGGIAYVSQNAFLLNATIRDNILFGNPYDDERYRATIDACALARDLEVLDGGDLTEIGEKGINLSGGQKQRISLARAVYSPSPIVLLDDPLSAVDAPTAKYLVKYCLLGKLMAGRTRLLVTHATSLVLPISDYVVCIKNGEVAGAGTLQEVLKNPNVDISLSHSESIDDEEPTTPTDVSFKGIAKEGTKIISEEDRARGTTEFSTYITYFLACGGPIFVGVFVILFAATSFFDMFRNIWIKIWVEGIKNEENLPGSGDFVVAAAQTVSASLNVFVMPLLNGPERSAVRNAFVPLSDPFVSAVTNTSFFSSSPDTMTASVAAPTTSTTYYVGMYAIISVCSLVIGMVMQLWELNGGIIAGRAMHEKLLDRVFGAPLRFFEKTPIGRILNRFTKDVNTVDSDVMNSLSSFLTLFIELVSAIGVILFGAPIVVFFLIPISYVYLWIASIYLSTSRELQRLSSVSRSPIYAQFSETLNGASTIRSYGAEARSLHIMQKKLDTNTRSTFYLWAANRWLNFRCELTAAVFVFTVGLSLLLSGLGPGWCGLGLTYAIQITSGLTFLIRSHATLDISMNSVERVEEYCKIEQEPPAIIPDNRPPTDWPSRGEVVVKDLRIRYGADTPYVLHNLNFSIKPFEKIGVVGRTGAGKSTLSLAFFRILPIEGSITIDGVDISTIGLRDLRQRLTIIPQDPVLFDGTLRSNLDPMEKHTDEEIWEAIKRVGFLDSLQKEESTTSIVEEVDTTTTTTVTEIVTEVVVETKANGEETKVLSVTESSTNKSTNRDTLVITEDSSAAASGSGPANKESPGAVNGGITLDYAITEGGANLSQGQRQLLCMGRALLRNTRLIFLDEATASVDERNDQIIQQTIRNSFKQGTVLTIAHRLKTIIDYDRILVLDKGEVAQYDTPYNLMTTDGLFRHMTMESGEFDLLLEIATASRK